MNNNFHILELSAYQTPDAIEDPKEDFVSYGADNSFYHEIIDAYSNSPTSNSIITGVVNQIVGKGLHCHDADRKPNEYAKFKSLFKDKEFKRVALDLKLLGEAALQITYRGKKVAQISHFNRETLRAEKCDKNGKINAYYYHPKWSDYSKGDKLIRIPTFGSGGKNEIYIIRRHIPGMHYYSPPDWVGSLNYAKLECEISEYLMNEVSNSFSGTKLVSFTNGVPSSEKQQMIKNEILNKLTGSNGEKVIVSFSDTPENKTTIEDISVSDAADVYSYISEECTRKLLLGHRITSPLLVGIRDGNQGLGSNSEEIQNAHNLFENVVIKPYQNDIIEALKDILTINGITLDIFVQTLTPIEFVEVDENQTKEEIEEETGKKLSIQLNHAFDDNNVFDALNELAIDEEDLKDYDLVDERAVDYDNEEALDKMIKLTTTTGVARPNSKSKEDQIGEKVQFKVLYQYAPLTLSKDPNTGKINSREFCQKMVNARKLYRKEDILLMENLIVNKGWGPGGTDKYSIWLYKGGGNCGHYWVRKTFMYRDNIAPDVKSPLTSPVTVEEARKNGFKPPQRIGEETKVRQKPKNMKNKGFLNPR